MDPSPSDRPTNAPTNAPTSAPKPKPKRGRVYLCGYPIQLAEYMFPEYEFMGKKPIMSLAPDEYYENDLLVVGMHGPGCPTSFAGKTLYFNGEPNGDAVSDLYWKENGGHNNNNNTYQIGPYPPINTHRDHEKDDYTKYRNQHSLLVYHTAMEFFSHAYLSTYYGKTDSLRDIDPFQPNVQEKNSEKNWSPALGEERKQQQQQSPGIRGSDNNNNGNSMKFDPWKQLVKGNGRNFELPPRIPAIVYVSRNCVSFRQDAAVFLANQLKQFEVSGFEDDADNSGRRKSFVHYGGQCRVKGGIRVPSKVLAGWKNGDRSKFRNNYETIYTRYKYCLVMENSNVQGYVTEKLMHALLGGCLPIYYGSKKDVYKIFRQDAFIFFDLDHPSGLNEVVSEIQSLESNHSEYLRRTDPSRPILRETIATDGTYNTDATVDEYFSLLPHIGTGKLLRKIYEMMDLPYDNTTRWTPPHVEAAPAARGTSQTGSFGFPTYTMKSTEYESWWHDVPLRPAGESSTSPIINMVTEIPMFTTAKMEVNKSHPGNAIKQDINKDGSPRYYSYGTTFFNYGLIPQTWEDPELMSMGYRGDNDPIDVMELGNTQLLMGSITPCHVIGELELIDNGETDHKILCIARSDPLSATVHSMDDLEQAKPGTLDLLLNWLKYYKTTDGKPVNSLASETPRSVKGALEVIAEVHARWQKLCGKDGTLRASLSSKTEDFWLASPNCRGI